MLAANRGVSVIGSFVLGIGFVFEDENEAATPLSCMKELLQQDPRNREVIRKYLGGEDLNSHPKQDSNRFVIDFEERSLDEARRWVDLFAIVEKKVKPARASVKQRDRREEWWRHATRSPLFRAHVSVHGRALALSQVSSHLAPAFVPSDVVLSHTCVMLLVHTWTAFAVIQSQAHAEWARLLGSSMKNDPRYTPTDCFETFPFPQPDPRTVIPSVEAIGERLYTARASYMIDTNQGLTQTYNQLKAPNCDDPRILALRELHEDMDRAVLDAYGWTDLTVPPFCPKTPDDQRALEQFQDTVIDRLFVLNAERAEEERRLGAAKPQKGKEASAAKGRAKGGGTRGRKGKADVTGAQTQLGFDRSSGEDR
jgi:hypothetical protein